MRTVTPLASGWTFRKDVPGDRPAAVTLPHTWNASDGQDGGNDYWRGRGVYELDLDVRRPSDGSLVYLEVTGAAMRAEVAADGKVVCRHEGGYSTFRADLTGCLHADAPTHLEIAVDNSYDRHVYPQKADFTFYGGLYREVNLITVPKAHFSLDRCGGPGLRITPHVADDLASAEVEFEAWADGAEGREVIFRIEGVAEKAARVVEGRAHATLQIEGVRLWDGVNDPHLYHAVAALGEDDEVGARFGCRRFSVDPDRGFILNGRPYPLRGVSRHQDRAGVGCALTPAMHAEDADLICEVGANTVRLAHYQHDQEFYDLCDERGLVVWAEIPYITMHEQAGRANTLSQMEELIVQNYNHPSIVCWGLSNEITAAPVPPEAEEGRLENHRALNGLCHRLDATRPTAMANVFMLDPSDPILTVPDLNSYNLYFGWYLGELEQNDEFLDDYHARFPTRCIGLAEYGADANPSIQTSDPRRGDYSEAYQCVYHEHMLRMIESRPWLWATHAWNMFDFAADGRDEGGLHGVNQKGLVSFDRTVKKDAFFAYKAWWSREPFVHVCGSRYTDRTERACKVKVYSNQSRVTLYLDGEKAGECHAAHAFCFEITLEGDGWHRVEARALTAGDREIVDVIRLRHVDEPNPSYLLGAAGDVTNWFDRDDTDPSRYSINDTLGELQANPQAAALLGKLMAKGAAARGDVAESVKDNPQLQRMMARMTLRSVLAQVSDLVTPQEVRGINAQLQKIEKGRE